MKKLVCILTVFSSYLYPMDPKVMPGPWCVLFNKFKPKVIRHANFHECWAGYGCDNKSKHNLNLFALDNDYAIPVANATVEGRECQTILVAAENQHQYEADNYQIVVLKAPASKKWRRATKYPTPHNDDDSEAPERTPVVYSTLWEKAYVNDDTGTSNDQPNNRTEWVTAADWVKWAVVSEPDIMQTELTNWDKPALERLALLKKATARAALFCYINQKLHPDDPAFINTRYQNEIRNLEGLGRVLIQFHPNDFPARQAAQVGAIFAVAGGAIAGPPGALIGGALGAVNGYYSITKTVVDEDEDRFERCANILNI